MKEKLLNNLKHIYCFTILVICFSCNTIESENKAAKKVNAEEKKQTVQKNEPQKVQQSQLKENGDFKTDHTFSWLDSKTAR